MDASASPPQGAAVHVVLKPIPERTIRKYGRMALAVALAQWAAYQLSIWHEIATFYGYASVAAWIQGMLKRLGAVSLEDSRAAMRAVDGPWWDSSKRIPEWTLVTRRRFDTGPRLRPWRLEDASPGTEGPIEPLAACRDAAPPLVLHIADGFHGAAFRDHATLEFEIDDTLAAAGFPLPRPDSRLVTQDDLPAIIAATRAANAETFGPGADAP